MKYYGIYIRSAPFCLADAKAALKHVGFDKVQGFDTRRCHPHDIYLIAKAKEHVGNASSIESLFSEALYSVCVIFDHSKNLKEFMIQKFECFCDVCENHVSCTKHNCYCFRAYFYKFICIMFTNGGPVRFFI